MCDSLSLVQCERGSALHEAAMCGIVDFLSDYKAPRAKEIKKMIEGIIYNFSHFLPEVQ